MSSLRAQSLKKKKSAFLLSLGVIWSNEDEAQGPVQA